MEKSWNYIHYYIYLFERRASKIITYPIEFIFDLIYKLPFISKGLNKRGSSRIHLKEATDNAMNNLEYGQNITIAGIQMGGILVLLQYSIFNLIQAILGKSLKQYIWEDSLNKWIFLIGLLVIPAIINYHLLWKEDKYLTYFKKFEKEPKAIKRKWAWISFGVVVGIILLFIASFWIMIKAFQ